MDSSSGAIQPRLIQPSKPQILLILVVFAGFTSYSIFALLLKADCENKPVFVTQQALRTLTESRKIN